MFHFEQIPHLLFEKVLPRGFTNAEQRAEEKIMQGQVKNYATLTKRVKLQHEKILYRI